MPAKNVNVSIRSRVMSESLMCFGMNFFVEMCKKKELTTEGHGLEVLQRHLAWQLTHQCNLKRKEKQSRILTEKSSESCRQTIQMHCANK